MKKVYLRDSDTVTIRRIINSFPTDINVQKMSIAQLKRKMKTNQNPLSTDSGTVTVIVSFEGEPLHTEGNRWYYEDTTE